VGGVWWIVRNKKASSIQLSSGGTLADSIKQTANKFGFEPNLIGAMAKVESNFNPNAISPPNTNGTRDYGLLQINSVNFSKLSLDVANVLDPDINLNAAVSLLKDYQSQLADAGHTAINEVVSAYNEGVRGLETYGIRNITYVASVMGYSLLYKLRGDFK
jgi:soluble lytic murein transglycosylase-like protein